MPKIESRPEQPYAGKRVVMPMRDFETRVPELTDEVLHWLGQNGVEASGKPFLRYHVIDMPERMDVELGVPVDGLPQTVSGMSRGSLPAGRYAVSTFTGIANGIAANKALIDWIADQGEAMDAHTSANGEAFACRHETLLTDATAEPDQDRWETEIAIKLRD